MKVSAKGRYGLVAMTYLAQNYRSGLPMTIMSISKHLGVSKIYLEQVFSLLKRAKLVVESVKGAQGGYFLITKPANITVYKILSAIEMTLMEDTVSASKIDKIVTELFQAITLEDIITATEKESDAASMMYYI